MIRGGCRPSSARRARFLLSGALALGLLGCGAGDERRPNIIFFFADDLGWSDPSGGHTNAGHGSRFHETPQLERLAQEGLSFTSVYAAQHCAPSRAAWLTGQSAPRSGVYHNWGIFGKRKTLPLYGAANRGTIRPDAVTIAETLKNAGYTTVHVGKFHVGSEESITAEHGFDVNIGGRHNAMPKRYHAQAFPGRGWDFGERIGPGLTRYARPYTQQYVSSHIRPHSRGTPEPALRALVGTPKHLSDALTDAALDSLRELHAAGRPFFLDLNHYAPHIPIQPRADLLAKYRQKLPSADERHTRAEYAALLEGLDQSLARILAFLDDPNGDEDGRDSIAGETLLVFMSDNGGTRPGNNAPLRGIKGRPEEGGLRAPLIARQPGVVPAGEVNESLICITDLYATFAEFAEAQLPESARHPLDSLSFANLLRGESTRGPRDATYLHLPGYSFFEPTSQVVTEIDGRHYKLVYRYEAAEGSRASGARGVYALYDLSEDIGEARDLLAEEHPSEASLDAAERASRGLIAWLAERDAPYPTLRDPQTNESTGVSVGPPHSLDVEQAGESGSGTGAR